MKTTLLAILGLMAGSSLVWGADTKENLMQARSHYQQAVAQHGANSPEARNARRQVRSARRAFHTERRQRSHR